MVYRMAVIDVVVGNKPLIVVLIVLGLLTAKVWDY